MKGRLDLGGRLPLWILLTGLTVLVGLIPLLLLGVLSGGLFGPPLEGRQWPLATGVAVLVVLAVVLSAVVATYLRRSLREVAEAARAVAAGRLNERLDPVNQEEEINRLNSSFNQMVTALGRQFQSLEREQRESRQLLDDAKRLFEAAVTAKEPLTKSHPGLVDAYTRAVARHMGRMESSDTDMWADVLLKGNAAAREAERPDRRSTLRSAVSGVQIVAPIPSIVVDLSENGMGIESLQAIAVGREMTFEIRNGARGSKAPGVVKWCKLTGTFKGPGRQHGAAMFRAGVAFAGSLPRQPRRLLLSLLSACATPGAVAADLAGGRRT